MSLEAIMFTIFGAIFGTGFFILSLMSLYFLSINDLELGFIAFGVALLSLYQSIDIFNNKT
jgi:hypothetical protein